MGTGTGSFGAKTDFATGSEPLSVAVDDFNGDGKLDLAVANSNDDTVSILLGTGTGSFGAKTDFDTGGSAFSVAVRDLNGDGKLDLAVANTSTNTVSILLGTGTGSFGAKTDFGTGINPNSVAVGDFNGDGKLDLATANFSSNTVSILLGTGTGSFGARTDFGTGAGPFSVAVGDFNGDGKLDLAAANFNSNTVSILLGTGTGSFGAKADFGTGLSPEAVAVGEFNGDGKLDLALASRNSDTVSILLGTGTGSFGAKTDFGTGSGPVSVTVSDFNGDGKFDLALANLNAATVSILLNSGADSFGAKTDFGTGTTPISVAVGDFNGDDKLDLAVANINGATVSILLGTGAGSFGPKTDFSTGSRPASVAVGDFNGDGKLDLAVAKDGAAAVSILLGTGTGSFGANTDFGTGSSRPVWVAVGDFNGDGNLDLAVANVNGASVSILLGTGTGSFGAKTDFGTGGSPASVAVGDFNGDGKLDLAVANQGSATVSILLGTGTGSFGAKTDFGTGGQPRSVAAGDFNEDGKLDLAVANFATNTVSILLGTGTGSFGTKTDFGTGSQPGISVAVGDVNGDGNLDLAVANQGSASVSILLGMGTGSFGAKTDFGTGNVPLGVAVGDFNGDGKLDLAVANTGSNTISILLNTTPVVSSGVFCPKTDFGTSGLPVSVAVGDFNGDGKLDLATANSFSFPTTVSILLGTGTGSLGLKTDFGTGAGPRSVAAGDFNGDGRLDLAVANFNSNTVSILLGTGTGSFGAKTDFSTGNLPVSVAVADLNGDGKLDLAVANQGSATVSILLGTGTGSFGVKTDFGTGTAPISVAVGDFNVNGKPDLAVANFNSNTVSILLGTGTGSFGAKADFGTGNLPHSVAAGDFNGDGKLDLVVANQTSATVSILLGTGSGSFGAKTDFGTGSNPVSVAVGDLNGDGKLDIAVANQNNNTVSILPGTGTGGFGPKTDFGTGTFPEYVALGDFNGDGKLDLAPANEDDDTVSILLNNGPPSITAALVTRTAGNPSASSQIATVGDAQQVANTLGVKVNGGTSATVNGVTVTLNPAAPNASGQVFADVVAACAATTANFTLRATDGCGLFTEATLTVTVTPPPTSISPTSQSFTQSGGADTVNVTSPSSCTWTAVSNDAWITVTTGASGSGNGIVNYSVAVNNSLDSRTGTMTIAGQTFTVNQAAVVCAYSILPIERAHVSEAGSDTVSVSAPGVCSWTAASNDSWLSINSGANGAGDGIVGYSYEANESAGSRIGTLTIAGQTFTVTQSGPTAVELISAAAIYYDNGVFIHWQTGMEVENLGFHIYREAGGQRTRITPEVVAGSALIAGNKTTLTAGNSYAWFDAGGKDNQDAQYWLEDIDIDGKSTLHGPISPKRVGGLPPEQSTAALLSRMGKGQPYISQLGSNRAAPVGPSQKQFETQWDFAGKSAIKLTIKGEGWYRVTRQELLSAGLDPKTDPRNLQLYLEGREQAMLVSGEEDASLDQKDAIEFYATGQNVAYTDAHTYWLVSGKQPGKRVSITKSDAKPGGASGFSYTVERKERTIYFSSLKNGDAENFFGRVISPQPVDQELTLQHLDQTSQADAVLEVALQGVTDLPGIGNDHQVRVTLNGAQVGRIFFDGRQHQVERFAVPQGALKEGDNVVTLVAEAGPSDICLVDYVRVTHQHTYTADQDALRMTVAEQATSGASRSQTIDGFASSLIRVFDISNPGEPQELIGRIEQQKGGRFAATVEVAGNDQRTLIALTADRIKHPVSIAANQPSSLRDKANRADLLMITHRAFANSLEPLKTLRQKQGFAVETIDIEDIYDEFSFGEKSPQAVRDFLAYARASWQLAPRFVLLAGDASFDPRNYLGAGDFDFVPTKLIDTTYLETASDDWFVDFNDDGLSEMYVGRLPVRTPAEAAVLVSKIVNYDSSITKGVMRQKSVLLVADKNDGFDFEQASSQLRGLVPAGTNVQEIFRGRLDDASAKKQLISLINAGQSIVNYTGHGSTNVWRSLFTTEDARSLNNRQALPLFVTMTCLNGFFQDPVMESLAEGLLKSERGGAVAVWASSALTAPGQQAVMNQQAYRLLFAGTGGLTLGEVTSKAKVSVSDIDIRRTWILFGDPTTRLK
ncbi:MAG: FG-GAP-like repeat-containing protein [Acidobacteriota bacterium]